MLDGDSGNKIAYNLSDGNFYGIGLSKKKNIIFTDKIDKQNVSGNDIERLESILPKDIVTQDQGAVGGLFIPKLSIEQVNKINEEKQGTIVKLKDSDGKEHNVIIVEEQSGEKIAYKVNEGSLGKVGRSRKGNEIIRESISSNDLSESSKNKLEDLFIGLNIGYTRLGEGVTEGSNIVGGARRKTRGVTQTSTGAAGTSGLRPRTSGSEEGAKTSISSDGLATFKGRIFSPDRDESGVDIYTGVTKDGIEYNYIVNSDGSTTKVGTVNGKDYIPVLSERQLQMYVDENPQYIVRAKDGIGNSELVVIIEISNGEKLAYQLRLGIFRHVSKSNEGFILGKKFDVETLNYPDYIKMVSGIFNVGTYLDK